MVVESVFKQFITEYVNPETEKDLCKYYKKWEG